MASVDGRVEFCEGCPAQGNFIGEITEDVANIDVRVPLTISDKGSSREQIHSVTNFVDVDGGESGRVYHWVHSTELPLYGVANTTRGPLYASERTAAQEKETATIKEALPAIIARVGRCAHAGVTADGERYCPALKSEVIRKLINPAQESVQQAT